MSGDGSGDDLMDRLVAIVSAIPEFKFTARDEVEIGAGTTLPGCVVLEGEEEGEAAIKNRQPAVPTLMKMFPLISIAVEATASEVGRDLRVLRRKVIKAVLTDATLLGLLGSNGGMIYRGFVCDFVAAEKIVGRMALRFELHYWLKPALL